VTGSHASEFDRRVEHVMGMPISLALRGRHAFTDRADGAWAAALTHLRWVDIVFSTWRPDSWVSRMARGEATGIPPAEVGEVLALAERARVESGGAFDVRRPGVPLDPSGVVKGWAVERAMACFDDLADTDVCLSAGGDMACRSRMALSPGWRVGIEDPHDPSRIVAVVPVRSGAVATSGLAHRGAHVTDPRTGSAPDALASVTVIADDLTWADIDATAALVMGEEAAGWLTGRGRTAVIVDREGLATVHAPDPVVAPG